MDTYIIGEIFVSFKANFEERISFLPFPYLISKRIVLCDPRQENFHLVLYVNV